MAADDHRHRSITIHIECRDRRLRCGRDAVIDIQHAIHLADLLLTMRQRRKVLGRAQRRSRIDAKRPCHRQRAGQVGQVVRAREIAVATCRSGHAANVAWSSRRDRAPRDRGNCVAADQRVPRMTQQIQLVAPIRLDAAVPVEMLLMQRGQHGDVALPGEIRRLVARHLDHRGIQPVARQFRHRHADIARRHRVPADTAQDVRDQRRRRALALGAGDADRPACRRIGEPQIEQRGEPHAVRPRLYHQRIVEADARRLHHHVEAADRRGDRRAPADQRHIDVTVAVRIVQHRDRQARIALAQEPQCRPALARETPDRNASAAQFIHTHRASPGIAREPDAAPAARTTRQGRRPAAVATAPAPPRRRAKPPWRRDAPSPWRSPRSRPRIRTACAACSPHSSANPSICAGSSSMSRPNVATRRCRGHERRQRQEHEAAFRTVAAPVGAAALRRLAERGVAAAEHREILPHGARSGARWQPRTAAAARRNSARPPPHAAPATG